MKALKNTVLIIEDDAGLIELLNDKIQGCGFKTACILTAAEALEWLKKNTPLLILLDYSLPDMTGWEFIDKMKTESMPVPPFVLATGQGDERIAVDMMKLGARDYIIKDGHFLEMIPLVISRIGSEIENENKLKEIEQALVESNQFSKQIIESAQEGIIVYDLNQNIITWNPFMEKLTGVHVEEIAGKKGVEIFPFLKDTGLIDNIEKAIHGELKPEIELPFYFPVSTESGWASDAISTLRNANNEIIGAISIVRDITDRKQAAEDMQMVKQTYLDIFNSVSEAIYVVDETDTFIDVNKGAEKMFGLTREELIGQSLVTIAAPDVSDLGKIMRQLAYVKQMGVPVSFEFWAVRKNGEAFPTEVSVNKGTYFNQDVLLVTARDITQRKQREEALRASEELYRNLMFRIPDGVYKSTPDGKFIEVNPAMVKMLGYDSKKELMDIDIKSQLYVDISDRDHRMLKGEHQEMSVIQLKKKDGSTIWMEDHGWYNIDSDGNVISNEGVLRDITERKQAQDELQERENMRKKTLEESTSLIKITTEGIDYEKICDTVLEISGAKYGSFNVFDENGLDFSTLALSGVKENLMNVVSFLGFEVINKKWNHDPIRAERTKDKTITQFESLNELSNFSIPESISTILEEKFNLGMTYVVKIASNNNNLGDFTLMFARGETLRNSELVSLYANQVGLFIERKRAEEALKEKMDELMRFQKVMVDRELTMIELKKEINELLVKSGQEEKFKIVG